MKWLISKGKNEEFQLEAMKAKLPAAVQAELEKVKTEIYAKHGIPA